MNFIESISHSFTAFIQEKFSINQEQQKSITFNLNLDEGKKEFGDLNSNAALVLAKELKRKPLDIAQEIKSSFTNPALKAIEIAGPGFLNFFLTQEAYIQLAHELFQAQGNFFKLDPTAPKNNYSLEFVSANPTGHLHLGHGRGGIIGDVLGNILKFLGHNVTKEFYINDAGSQIKKLGLSLKIRCQQLLGQDINLPEEAYHGEYLIDLAKECIKTNGQDVLNKPDEFFASYAKELLLKDIQNTLKEYGINFDIWFSEKTLHTSGAIEQEIKKLIQSNNTYEKDGALWFKSTEYGDDKDRVLRKKDGELTYIAADIAYLDNKITRGFDHLIIILGQDHHSYVSRLKGILQAMGRNPAVLDVILYQLVSIKESGAVIRMSKRSGKFIILKDIIDTVGADVARFFYLNRKADAHLEFDIDLALKKTDENPVYYIQYAYVRTCSILEKAKEIPEFSNLTKEDLNGISSSDASLIKKIISLKELLKDISSHHQTHLLTYYLLELSHSFHRYYNDNRVIEPTNIPQSRARLLLIKQLKDTFAIALDLLGISKPEKM